MHYLLLLKALDTIPEGEAHSFLGYVPDPKKVADAGCVKTIVSHSLEISFRSRRTPAGKDIVIPFKSRGPALEEVVAMLCDQSRRKSVTSHNPNYGSEALQKKDEKAEKATKKAQTDAAKKRPEQGVTKWAFDDLKDDPIPPAPTGTARGAPKFELLDSLVIPLQARWAENKSAVRLAHVEKSNYLTMMLICHAGLPPAIIGNDAFKALIHHFEADAGIKVASTFSSICIPQEAVRVDLLVAAELKKHYNLNLGYDGGTTTGQ
ncbi:hypothetical protein DFH09DRAFT_1306043 [Mycena vulgaris]|nr:hypothetical protein DFH09DRAFT_1306043 [Mycena vulgaris]